MIETAHTPPPAVAPGVYADLSNEEYHGGPGLSKSGLDLIRDRSPATYRYVTDNPKERTESSAMRIGTAVHAAILEPDAFAKDYCLGLRRQDAPEAIDDREELAAMVEALNADRLPKLLTGGKKDELVERILSAQPEEAWTPDQLNAMKAAELKDVIAQLNTARPGLLSTSGSRHDLAALLRENGQDVTLWSDVKAEWEANNGHRIILSEEEYSQVTAMRDAVMAHPAAGNLMRQQGIAERSVYWVDPATGVLCRCRPDWWVPSRGVLVDVKTTDDASPEAFGRSIMKWAYHRQHPYYVDGCNHAIEQAGLDWPEQRYFVFVVVEKAPPYNVAVYTLDDDSVTIGSMECRETLNDYSECLASDDWPAYSPRVETVSLPEWHIRRHLPARAE